MSFKFRRDGAVFPTKVENGQLIINMGMKDISIPFKFLNGIESSWDNSDFPMSNVMCYLKHKDGVVIMRFDGSVNKFNNDMVVVGMSKFDRQTIYDETFYLPVGTVANGVDVRVKKHMLCSIYSVKEEGFYILECIGDPEPIVFKPEENPEFTGDIFMGNRYYPRLVKIATNTYAEDTNRYVVRGSPIRITGYVNL